MGTGRGASPDGLTDGRRFLCGDFRTEASTGLQRDSSRQGDSKCKDPEEGESLLFSRNREEHSMAGESGVKPRDHTEEFGFYSKSKGKPLVGFRRVTDMLQLKKFFFTLAALWLID